MFITGLLAIPLTALAVAGCGGGSDDAASAATPATTAMDQAATVSTSKDAELGTILVDSKGRTLYLFEKDTGTTSECNGACAAAWPPLMATGMPTVDGGAKASLIGTTQRSDGSQQVTYNGHPLYLFASDTKPGDTKGQDVHGFGAGWYVLDTAGNKVSDEEMETSSDTTQSSSSDMESSSPSSYGGYSSGSSGYSSGYSGSSGGSYGW
jgi:predicted lipoprotein with Yx(FWY)xxD motif